MALSDASREAIAKPQLYAELRIKLPPPLIFSDSRGALDIYDNPTNYENAKHIDIRYHFNRHILQEDKLWIDQITFLLMLSQRRSILLNINPYALDSPSTVQLGPSSSRQTGLLSDVYKDKKIP
jgi:hypothetical protein